MVFALTFPAALFTEVHHGSFARAISTVAGIGLYVQTIGDFRRKILICKAAILIVAFAIHLQGAIFVGILLISEVISYSFKRDWKPLIYFLLTSSVALLGIGIFLLGNVYYMNIVNHDALDDLFNVWRTQVISSHYSWLTFTITNLFTAQGFFYGFIKFLLMLYGGVYLWKNNPRVLVALLIFVLACFFYVGLLLYLPRTQLIEFIATPFVGVISRIYEGISIAILFISLVGFLNFLNSKLNTLKMRLVCAVVLIYMLAPAMLVQVNLLKLAKTFDTMTLIEFLEIEKLINGERTGKVLIISEDNRFMALDNGSNTRSYLSYFDCPLPYDNSLECLRRLEFAKSIVNASNSSQKLTLEMNNKLDGLIEKGYKNIYIASTINKNNINGTAVYYYDSLNNKIIMQSFIPIEK
jgi:hypothetical protein